MRRLVAILVIVLLGTGCTGTNSSGPASLDAAASPVLGERAPTLRGHVLHGPAFNGQKEGRWLVVNFFATWCDACVQEQEEVAAFMKDHAAANNVQVVTVIYGDRASAATKFFDRHDWTGTVLDPDGGRTALNWGVAKVPESFLVAPDKTVVERFQSPLTREQLEDSIQAHG